MAGALSCLIAGVRKLWELYDERNPQQRMAAILTSGTKDNAVNPSEFSEIIDENGNVVKIMARLRNIL